ncbi:MAG: DUF4434 domain-containing protein, partial [Promethearchaeota archaeon]
VYHVHWRYWKIPARGIDPVLSGTFVQYSGLSSWGFSEWDTEFNNLKQIGIDTVILQWALESGTNETYYQSGTFPFKDSAVSPLMKAPGETDPDVVRTFFYLAHEYEMKFWLGLSIDWEFWTKLDNATWKSRELTKIGTMVSELLQSNGNETSWVGFYIPYESSLGTSTESASKIGTFFGDVVSLVRTIEDGVNTTVPRRSFAIAPFAGPVKWAPTAINYWKALLSPSAMDVVMIQDGVGCLRNDVEHDLPAIFATLKDACHSLDITLWVDVEIFTRTSVDGEVFQAEPASINGIEAQLEVASRYAESLVSFDIPHYMSDQYSNSAKDLYADYSLYITTV